MDAVSAANKPTWEGPDPAGYTRAAESKSFLTDTLKEPFPETNPQSLRIYTSLPCKLTNPLCAVLLSFFAISAQLQARHEIFNLRRQKSV